LGNAGTSESNFIGTTDAQPFVVRTANARSLRIEPSSITFFGFPITTNTIAGSSSNLVSAGVRGATIAGGGVPGGDTDPDLTSENPNRVRDHYGTVSGGYGNDAGDGLGTPDDRAFATVGGGRGNNAFGESSTIGGGDGNSATGFRSTVGGGKNTTASGTNATVGGGEDNTASGSNATVGGGESNCAGGIYSWAGGRRAKVRPGIGSGNSLTGTACEGVPLSGIGGDAGTFVWAGNQTTEFVSTGENQFLVRAVGGMAINANNPFNNALRVNGTLRVDELGIAGGTTLCRNIGNVIAACSSSARYKRDIDDLELGLSAVLRLRAVGYRWKDSGQADVGFVAEEIAALDERLVTRNERGQVEGVKYDRLTALLANAVQELAARDSLAAERLGRVEADNAALRARLQAIEARLGLTDSSAR
jgi:hypothetical protein